MFGFSMFEMAAIGVIAVVLFGGNLPEVARKLGGSYRELRRSLSEVQQQFRMAEHEVTKGMSLDDQSKIDTDEDEEESREPSVPKFTPPT